MAASHALFSGGVEGEMALKESHSRLKLQTVLQFLSVAYHQVSSQVEISDQQDLATIQCRHQHLPLIDKRS
eukprot:759327-Hanusia_phi.AAC.2